MIEFTLAEEVAAGQPIVARNVAAQARARADRLRHGNGAWRYHFWHTQLWQQVRVPVDPENPAANWPALGEFSEFYQHVDNGLEWPVTDGEGEPNLASPMMAWWGGPPGFPELGEAERSSCNPMVNLEAECPRGVPTLLPGGVTPVTKKDLWDLGMMQRGGIDLANNVSGARLRDSATAYYEVLIGFGIAHHRCFGGYVPQPETTGEQCMDGTIRNSMQIFFTGIDKGPATKPPVYFDGTCPPIDTNPRPTHIAFMIELPGAYWIILNNGTVHILSKKDYIEGPYQGGGQYRKLNGEQALHMINAWIADFRGDADQREEGESHNRNIARHAYPFRKMLRAQYFGSPQRAVWTEEDGLQLQIPSFVRAASGGLVVAAGTQIGGNFANATGWVTAGIWAKGTKLAGPVRVKVMNDQTQVHEFEVRPSGVGGDGEYLYYLDSEMDRGGPRAQRFAPLRLVLASELEFTAGDGELRIEVTDQLEYKPEIDDIYLLLRLATGAGSQGQRPDEMPDANNLWEGWAAQGCVVSDGLVHGVEDHASGSPFVEQARRWTRKTTRTIPRVTFKDIEVAGGKTILYFQRYYIGLDQWEGIGPSLTPVEPGAADERTGIKPGVVYWVRTFPDSLPGGPSLGNLTYNGVTYEAGQTFTGVAGVYAYVSNSGNAKAYVREGIVHPTSPMTRKGWTNEWVGWVETFPYSYGEGNNLFYPNRFADYLIYFNRCHFYSPYLGPVNRPNLWDQMTLGQQPVLNVAAPDGYNFAEGVNGVGTLEFNTSCQMYQPPPEIESVISFADPVYGQEVVKLTFRGRFQHCPGAPSSFTRDRGTWNVVALQEEPYRTAENALREYLLNVDGGGAEEGASFHCTKNKAGDGAYNNQAWELYSNLWGSCYPRFFFVKLPEEPTVAGVVTGGGAVDGEADWEVDSDGLVDQLIHWSMIDRAIAPGFVDEATSKAFCDADRSNLMDYTYANLNFETTGRRWVSPLAASLVRNGVEQGRADLPMGFGPLPRCYPAAETFNQFARNINKLTKLRVMGDFLELNVVTSRGELEESATEVTGDECGGVQRRAVWRDAAPSAVTTVDEESSCDGASDCVLSAYLEFGLSSDPLDGNYCWGDGSWKKFTRKQSVSWNFVTPDAAKLARLHPEIRDLFDANRGYLMARLEELITAYEAVTVNTEGEAHKCSEDTEFSYLPFWDFVSTGTRFDDLSEVSSECQMFPLVGSLEAEAVVSDVALCIGSTATTPSGRYAGGPNLAGMTRRMTVAAGAVVFVDVPTRVYDRSAW